MCGGLAEEGMNTGSVGVGVMRRENTPCAVAKGVVLGQILLHIFITNFVLKGRNVEIKFVDDDKFGSIVIVE